MTDDKVNTIVDIYQTLIDLKKNGTLVDLDFNWDEENNTLEIKTVPKQVIKHIQLNFTVTPTGIDFDDF